MVVGSANTDFLIRGPNLPTAHGSIQHTPLGNAMPATTTNFEGVNNIDGVEPPDTNGDVGPNNYVQWVNLHYQVFDRTGTSLLGPSPGNTLWSGFGGSCEADNDGAATAVLATPVVLDGDAVLRFLTFDRRARCSILAMITQARENARPLFHL